MVVLTNLWCFFTRYSRPICKSFNESSLRPIWKFKTKNSVIRMILCKVTEKIWCVSLGQLNSELILIVLHSYYNSKISCNRTKMIDVISGGCPMRPISFYYPISQIPEKAIDFVLYSTRQHYNILDWSSNQQDCLHECYIILYVYQ